MRITTWNINSVRLRLDTLRRVVDTLKPDVLCLQETKAEDSVFPADAAREMGFGHQLIRGQKAYNGVAILSKRPIQAVEPTDWCGRADCRHLEAKLAGGVEIHNFYVPAGGDIPDPDENDKFAHKLAFVDEMERWSAGLKTGKRILVGDLNIAPLESDVWSHTQLLKIVSHTPVETDGLKRVMAAHGWVDAIRHFHDPDEKIYSWWSYRNRTWPGSDRGRRLDHIWVSPPLKSRLKGATLFCEARGWPKPSDHIPVSVDIDL